MIVGEAPGEHEELQGVPFVGPSGTLLNNCLQKAGILRGTCFVTNVCRVRPPNSDITEWMSDNKKPPQPEWVRVKDRWVHPNIAQGVDQTHKEIGLVRPNLIIAVGGLALWTITGQTGILKWRGSRLSPPDLGCTVVPIIHPASVLRQMELLPVLQMDLKRVKNILTGEQVPRHYNFTIDPEFEHVKNYLKVLLLRAERESFELAGDIETRGGAIMCIGFATSPEDAFCIPLIHADNSFRWTKEQEAELVILLRRLFHHPNIIHIGQNYLYDCQYYYRHWGVIPVNVRDTMIGHHSIYSTLRKGLDFLSSMYCQDHVYWKDESKNWDPKVGERQYWTYNCKDSVTTWEAWQGIKNECAKQGLSPHFDFQQSLFHPVLRIMLRGIRVDKGLRAKMRNDLIEAALLRQEKLDWAVGHHLNPKSSKQLLEFFYHDMKIPGVKNIKTDKLSSDAASLEQICAYEPLLTPVIQLIAELRSIGVFLSTFIEAKDDIDGRTRSSFSIAGPTTYRFSSSTNAFDSGMNFQNLPTQEKVKLTKAKDYISLPNIRKLFIPDEGYEFFDMDLDRADLQVVVWEANDAGLKLALREGLDMHLFNAGSVWDLKIPLDELREDHPRYKDWKKKYGKLRQLAKQAVHATNYGVGDRKLSQTIGISQLEARNFKAKWFRAHPGIHAWHKRTEEMARGKGYIENILGARLYILGRFDLPEALGWLPQSTVAGVINRALVSIDRGEQSHAHNIQLLLQVHDSLAGQYPISEGSASLDALRSAGRIELPYPDPLVIPVGIKTSTISWGDCE